MALTSPNYSQSQSSSADERGDELKLGGAWRPFVVMLLPTPPQNALPGPRRNKPSPAQTQTFSPPSGSSSSANPPFWRREHKIQATCLFPPPSSAILPPPRPLPSKLPAAILLESRFHGIVCKLKRKEKGEARYPTSFQKRTLKRKEPADPYCILRA
ncbi:hypothetical protein CCUS01_13027 [Colletotrichum cuscutae]|uniref:Uncharacterized protein n=1 Tax=Colletotrichum cuscutae TaxID=1209917 RepID=A0AAJ0DQ32_9PEZI|nr:hypothetical protein CCUS01_13027 [Colletotrichum cuscutae]